MTELREHTVTTNGVDLHVVEAGEGPAVVLSHGFPELGYSWRHQIGPLADAGFHVIVPDQRGYGKSSRPEAIEEYTILHLTDDLLGLLDHFGVDDAAFVGHDWGAMIVWQMALLHPDRTRAVCGMSVPFSPRLPVQPLPMMRQALGEDFYIVQFQEPGAAEVGLETDTAMTMRMMLQGAGAASNDWITEDEIQFYVDEFSRTGFTGGLNWYRNIDRNWELTPQLADAHVKAPSLFIAGTADMVLTFASTAAHETHLDDHRGDVMIEGAGHWVQQERPDEVNKALLDFLG